MTDRLIQEIASAVIAIIAVIGAFLIAFYQLTQRESIAVPDFVSLLIGAVVGFYFSRVASVNGARQAGTAAAQTVVSANDAATAKAASAESS